VHSLSRLCTSIHPLRLFSAFIPSVHHVHLDPSIAPLYLLRYSTADPLNSLSTFRAKPPHRPRRTLRPTDRNTVDERYLCAEHIHPVVRGLLCDDVAVVDVGNEDGRGILSQSDRVTLPMWWGTDQGILEAWISDERVVQVLRRPNISFLVDRRYVLQLGPRPTACRHQVSG
jgi:hypothetical protein